MYAAESGKIYLIPSPIATNTHLQAMPAYVPSIVAQLRYFLVENIRTARRYVKALGHPAPMATLQFVFLNKHTVASQVADYLQPVLNGTDVGILSESGCPGIADPGALAIRYAHQHGLEVLPLVGPSSVFLALMASGLNGQSFVFHGYLSIDQNQRKATIKNLERAAWKLSQTQIFMETPYRNQVLLATLLRVCRPDTLLCIGKNITGEDGWVKTLSIQHWKKTPLALPKVPAIFLLYRSA